MKAKKNLQIGWSHFATLQKVAKYALMTFAWSPKRTHRNMQKPTTTTPKMYCVWFIFFAVHSPFTSKLLLQLPWGVRHLVWSARVTKDINPISVWTMIFITLRNFSKLDWAERRTKRWTPAHFYGRHQNENQFTDTFTRSSPFFNDFMVRTCIAFNMISITYSICGQTMERDLWKKLIIIHYIPSKTRTQYRRPAKTRRCSREHLLAWILDRSYFRCSPLCRSKMILPQLNRTQTNASPINLIASISYR